MGKSVRKAVASSAPLPRKPIPKVVNPPRHPVVTNNPIRILPIGGSFIQTSGYEDRRTYGRHGGIDLAPTTDDPFIPALAVNSGRIVSVRSGWNDGYGNVITLALDSGGFARYAHLDSFSVREGDRVNAGDILGNVGSSGDSTGRHLHFELRTGLLRGMTVDPIRWINELLSGGDQPAATQFDSVRTYVPNAKTPAVRLPVPVGDAKLPTRYSRPTQILQEEEDYPPGMPGSPFNPIIGRTPVQVVGRDISQGQFEATAAYNQSDPLGINRTYMEIRADVIEGYNTFKEDLSTVVEENIGFVGVAILAILVVMVTVYGLVK